MLFTGTMNPLFRPGLRKDFRDTWTDYPEQWPNFLKKGSTTSPEVSAMQIAGLSRMLELGDGVGITYEDPKMGNKVMAVDKEFGLGFIISRRAVEDDLYGVANQHAKWLANAARKTYEYRAAALLDDAFTGTYFKGFDGQPLLSTTHGLINSSATYANRPAVDVGLSITGITALLDLAQHAVDQNGDPIQVQPDTMVIGNNAGDLNRALQIWNSELEPFTAENQENALRLRMQNGQQQMPKKSPFVSVFKQSTKSYFLIDSKLNDAHLDVRRAVEMDDTQDFDTGALKYKATTRFMVYFFDNIGWFGANPT